MDDLLKFIKKGGNTVPNPEYNPKTKKGKIQPPYIISTKPKDSFADNQINLANKHSYGLTHYGDERKYTDYNVTLNPINTEEEINKERANNQSAIEQLGNMTVQMGLNEFLIGSVKGLSDIIDGVYNVFTNEENDYTNPVSKYLEEVQDGIKERFAIYQKDPNASFALGDFGWWTNNFISVASTLSMLIPSTGIVKGLSAISKLTKLDKLSRGTAKLLAGANNMRKAESLNLFSNAGRTAIKRNYLVGAGRNFGKIEDTINDAIKLGATATFSRIAENYMESRDVYKTVYDDALDKLNKLEKEGTEEDIKRFYENNPDFIGKSKEDIAKSIAYQSGHETYVNDFAMLLFDIPQFKAISSIWKGSTRPFTTAAERIANRNAIRRFAGVAEKDLEKANWLARRKEAARYMFTHPLKSIGALELSEGVEEFYQGMQQNIGQEVAAKIFDPNVRTKTFEEYLQDPQQWEQFVWGAIGGIVFQAGAIKGHNLLNKAKAKWAEHKGDEITAERLRMSQEKLGIETINKRLDNAVEYRNKMQIINSGRNPEAPVLDKEGNPVIEDGNIVYEEIDATEQEILRKKVTDSFIQNMTIDEIEAGTYDLFEEFIESPEFDKWFRENGIETTTNDKEIGPELKRIAKETNKLYSSALKDIYANVDKVNESVAQKVARDITKLQFQSEQATNNINVLNSYLASLPAADQLSANWMDRQRLNIAYGWIKGKNGIEAKREANRKNFENGVISKAAYERNEADIKKEELAIYNYIANNTTYGAIESIKKELEKAGVADSNILIAELHSLLKKLNVDEHSEKPVNKNTAHVANKQIAWEIRKDFIDIQIPHSQDEFREIYDTAANDILSIAEAKFNNSQKILFDWLKTQDDVMQSYKDALQRKDNVPADVRAAVDFLMIGHSSTNKFNTTTLIGIAAIQAERKKKEEERKRVNVNGQIIEGEQAERTRQQIETVTQEEREEAKQRGKAKKRTNIPTGEQESTETTETSEDEEYDELSDEETEELNATIEQAEKTIEEIEQQEAAKIADDVVVHSSMENDLKALDIAKNIFNEDNSIYDELKGKDINDAEFAAFIQRVVDKLIEQGVNQKYARSSALKGIKAFFNRLASIKAEEDAEIADEFRSLASAVATGLEVIRNKKKNKNDNSPAFSLAGYNDAQMEKQIDKFIEAYLNKYGIRHSKGKPIINLRALFEKIIQDPKISTDEAIMIFHNLGNYIYNNKKYVFKYKYQYEKYKRNPTEFFDDINNHKKKKELIDEKFHISAPTNLTEEVLDIINGLKQGDEITVEWGRDKDGYQTDSAISFKRKGVEIGYIGTVTRDKNNNYIYQPKQRKGLIQAVYRDANGIHTTFDEIFRNLIIGSTEEYSFLRDMIDKYNRIKINEEYGLNQEKISLEEENRILSLSFIADAILNGYAIDSARAENRDSSNLFTKPAIMFGKNVANNTEKVNFILNQFNNILNYDTNAQSNAEFLSSYEMWKNSIYKNYMNSITIEESLRNNNNFTIKYNDAYSDEFGDGELLINDENTDINDSELGLRYDKNPIIVVSEKNDDVSVLINEITGEVYPNTNSYTIGSMGMKVADKNGKPMIAFFTEENKLSDNPELAANVHREITKLLNDFQSGTITIDEVFEVCKDLFSGPTLDTSNLFNGYDVIKTDEGVFIKKHGTDGEIVLVFHKYKNKTDELGTGVTHLQDGDSNKRRRRIAPDEKFIKRIADEIVNNLTFNRTFYPIKNREIANDKSNRFLYKENGKLVVEIGGRKTVYNNFGEFVLKNNSFKTNQGKQNGSFFAPLTKIKSIYLDISHDAKPVAKREIESEQNLADFLNRATTERSINADTILKRIGLTEDVIDILTGKESGISLIDNKLYADRTNTSGIFYTKNGKVFMTKTGFELVKNEILNNKKKSYNTRNSSIVKSLIHEKLHIRLAEQGTLEREGIIKELNVIYDELMSCIEQDLNGTNATAKKYAKAAFEYLTGVKTGIDYTREAYFNNFTKGEFDKFTEEEKAAYWTEEFLVESLTAFPLTQYLNYRVSSVKTNVNDIENKSLLQKIIDLILKLFGINNGNIKNNTILAREYMLLSDGITNNINVEQSETKSAKKRKRAKKVTNETTVTPTDNNTDEQKQSDDVKQIDKFEENIEDDTIADNTILVSDNILEDEEDDIDESGIENYSLNGYENTEYEQRLQDILDKAPRNEQGQLLAPNGKVSNLIERQYAQVRTKEFIDWFGDWINNPNEASKIVDENGEPKIVKHFTNEKFTKFDLNKFGKKDNGNFGKGFYFTATNEDEFFKIAYGNNAIECFLNIKNPFIVNNLEDSKIARNYNRTEDLKNYDGVIVNNILKEIVVPNSNQIKSTIDNTGEFSSENDDIRYSLSGLNNEEISPIEQTIDKFKNDMSFNPNGYDTATSLNDYLERFDEQDKLIIADLVNNGFIQFVCR